MMTTLEILEQAKQLIDTPKKWWDGRSTEKHTQFCIIQATQEANGDGGCGNSADVALRRIAGVSSDYELTRWNDTSTHAEVMDLFDRAIAAEKAKQEAGQ